MTVSAASPPASEPPIPRSSSVASPAPIKSPLSADGPAREEETEVDEATLAGSDDVEKPRRTAKQRLWGVVKWIWNTLLEQWFLVGIAVVIALASQFPNVARPGGIIHSEWSSRYLFVAIIFFISGLSLPPKNLYARAKDWKLHLASHGTSFLFFPTVVFAIVSCVRAADPNFERFDRYALVGMVVLGCVPTTVSSNVVMTGQAGGSESAATIEVMIGNLLGTFLTPALLQMFLRGPWEFGQPVPSGGGGTTEIYRQVIQQLGFSVFIPLFVGELLQYLFPQPVKWARTTFRLAKVGSFCLILIIWCTFSGAFYEGVFQVLSGETIAFIVTVNIGLFVLHAALLFLLARYVPLPTHFRSPTKGPLFDPETTIALLFCGSAKGVALGGPIVALLYGGVSPVAASTLQLPLVIYQGSQVVSGQLLVYLLKQWKARVERREAEATLPSTKDVEGGKQ